MPPRKTPSKATSANEANDDRRAPPITSTAKRTMSSYRIRQDNTTPDDASLSHDELDAPVGAEKEVVLDEIVVSGTPQKSRTNGVDPNSQSSAVRTPAEGSIMVRRSSRTSSISQSGSSTLSPSGRGVIIKKQDFVVSIAADNDGEPDELSDPPTSKRQRVDSNPTKRVAVRKSRSKWDNHEEMLTDPNSPLVKAKLRELLCSPKAWEILTKGEREQILAKFPDDAEILDHGTPNARPDIAALRNNNNFRHDVVRYQEGLSKGFHDPEWIQQAQAAHRSRQLGFYDEFKASDFEERWDMPMPQQTQAEHQVNGKGSHDSPKEQMDEASTEAKATVSPGDSPEHRQGTDISARPQSPDVPHNNSADVSIQDQKDSPESANDSKIGPSDNTPEAGHRKRDKSPEIKNEEESTQPKPEAVATQNSTEMNGRKIEDHSYDSQAPSIETLPDAMEGVEQQSEEKAETTKAQEDRVMENTSAPAAVTSTHTAGGANETQHLHDERDAQGGSTEAEHQTDDK
ncbi:Asx homology domain-containing protein [Nemania sp. FL0031]|nr:Asx homology domain-containing protein [Nemania sp. FL0031]